MRTALAAIIVSLSACASVDGVRDQPPPFAASTSAATQAPYEQAVDFPSGTYRLDPRHASVTFRIRHMGMAWFTARFDAKDATLELNAQDPSASRLTANVGAASVNTGVLNRQGERAFDRQIGAALGAERSEQITFTSTTIVRTGVHAARINGDLTMNGQTHPAALDVAFAGAAVDPLRGGNQVLGFSAYGEIDRIQWGVTEWDAFTGDTVQIVIEAEFVKVG